MGTTITISHIGPITGEVSLELKRFNIIIGPQSSGKSTIMKIACFCRYVEKYCVVHNSHKYYTTYKHFIKELTRFHKLPDSFFDRASRIKYESELLCIEYKGTEECNNNVRITLQRGKKFKDADNIKLCFLPSERNMVSVFRNIDSEYKTKTNDNLFNFINEWDEIKRFYNRDRSLEMPFLSGMEFYYDSKNGREVLKIADNKTISPFYASSGVQSSMPMYVMIDYLTDKVFTHRTSVTRKYLNELMVEAMREEGVFPTKEFTEGIIDAVNARLKKRLEYHGSHIFIEEPEQNLFPKAQQGLIFDIARRINAACSNGKESSVFITTHSPYVITAFNLLINAAKAHKKSSADTEKIISGKCAIPLDQVSAYYVDEIQQQFQFKTIVDPELNMLGGDELDSASTYVEEMTAKLYDIIYAD